MKIIPRALVIFVCFFKSCKCGISLQAGHMRNFTRCNIAIVHFQML